jgi:hypothetical protein
VLIEIMDENVGLAIKSLDSAISMLYEYAELKNVNPIDEISLLGYIYEKLERKSIKEENF